MTQTQLVEMELDSELIRSQIQKFSFVYHSIKKNSIMLVKCEDVSAFVEMIFTSVF